MNEAGFFPPKITYESKCTGCMNCMIFCPDFAIMVEKGDSGHSGKTGDADE